jgi:hypothetical protein
MLDSNRSNPRPSKLRPLHHLSLLPTASTLHRRSHLRLPKVPQNGKRLVSPCPTYLTSLLPRRSGKNRLLMQTPYLQQDFKRKRTSECAQPEAAVAERLPQSRKSRQRRRQPLGYGARMRAMLRNPRPRRNRRTLGSM